MIVTNDVTKNQDLNSGVLIFKNDAWSKEFFGAVWESRHDFIPGEGCTKLDSSSLIQRQTGPRISI